jgi:ABC-type multidrug transport system ATPase subunit
LFNIDIIALLETINLNKNERISIKNKDMIGFLGDTETGKSTTIHFLAGCTLRKIMVDVKMHIEHDPTSSVRCE